MGTLVVKEDRKTIDKFRNWYKEKIVDTGKAAKFEKITEFKYNMYRKKNEFAGKVLPAILTFIPEASFLAPVVPTIAKVGEKCYDLEENAVIGAKRYLEANFIGVDGSNKEVILPNLNVDELGKDVADSTMKIGNAIYGANTDTMEIESVGRAR